MRDVQEAARIIDRPLRILKASTDSEIDAAFATFAQPRTGGLVVATDPFFNSRREKLVALAARHAVPAIYEWREFAQAGGLISYGPKPFRHLSSDWGLCRPGSRWCQACRSADPATDAVRVGHQPQGRQSAWPHRAAIDPRPRRRGDRMTNPATGAWARRGTMGRSCWDHRRIACRGGYPRIHSGCNCLYGPIHGSSPCCVAWG